MKNLNLAGRNDCDVFIEEELNRCRIPAVKVPQCTGEVAYTLIGKLGNYVFTRAWYYWIVDGPVPLHVAQILYDDPVGRTDIRVCGNCGCPKPEEWAKWVDDEGRYIVPNSKEYKDFALNFPNEYIFVDDPNEVAEGFIHGYDIDSELGLRIFVDAIKEYELDKVPDEFQIGDIVRIGIFDADSPYYAKYENAEICELPEYPHYYYRLEFSDGKIEDGERDKMRLIKRAGSETSLSVIKPREIKVFDEFYKELNQIMVMFEAAASLDVESS